MKCNDYKCLLANHDCAVCDEYFVNYEEDTPIKVSVPVERYMQLLEDSIKAHHLFNLLDALTKDNILNKAYVPEYYMNFYERDTKEKR